MAQRRKFGKAFKAKVAIEAIKGEKTLNDIASIYEVHPNQISVLKKQALEKLPDAMADEIYLREYSDGHELIRLLREYFDYYNHHRPHISLDGTRPADVYQPRRQSLRKATELNETLQLTP